VTSLLYWRYADKDDEPLRERFICASPPRWIYSRLRGRYHPKPWEIEVQSWIHPPRPIYQDEYLLLGLDDQGIGALSWWSEDAGPSDVMLKAVAVDVRHRGQGHGNCGPVASELIHETLKRLKRHAVDAGAESIAIQANIDRRNMPSKRLCGAAGFEFHARLDERYEAWSYDQDLA
jgi:GNAT superfamily N-acetyltransferase